MFEITSEHITLLSDEDLRALIGQLCESELAFRGYSRSCVTWGGNQNAADGGVDVRVSLPNFVNLDSFVPRSSTAYQVKKQDMPRSEILDEMRPNGSPRPMFETLAAGAGAYIIVSSNGSTSDRALADRRSAMREALADIPNSHLLHVDFFDRNRIASWVRSYPGLIIWVREKIGRSLAGWKPYGAWAFDPEGKDNEYLLDESVRFGQNPQTRSNMTASAGLDAIRSNLKQPSSVVRLIGLSGVGKTRFAQALFDARVGDRPLEQELAAYCNVADEPNPTSLQLVTDLAASGSRAVVVVDNCPPVLHRSLSDVTRSNGSNLSLLTIEYDIHEDQPEGTEVFELRPSSDSTIESLLRRRFSTLTQAQAQAIASFAGGNARVAISLATTVERGDDVLRLSDEELFQRLFRQRQENDDSLMKAAQACSLVYSFDGEDTADIFSSELHILARLCGQTVLDLHRHIVELRRRDLVQARGRWRAVLPHAIANRLASLALENVPLSIIREHFVQCAPVRLLKSLSRRLGYLPCSAAGKALVCEWLSEGGLLGNVAMLNDLGITMFENVVPANQDAALTALERAIRGNGDGASGNLARYITMIHSLAFDRDLFSRCSALMVQLAEVANKTDDQKRITEAFSSLFMIYLSGTHATIEQRVEVLSQLLSSEGEKKRELGVAALRASLEAWHFQAFSVIEFGAQGRDYGYWPGSSQEISDWFSKTLAVAERFAQVDPVQQAVKDAVASAFRGLWTKGCMYGDLERICAGLRNNCFWSEAWLAVRLTQRYDSAGFAQDVKDRLAKPELLLRPSSLSERVRVIVLSSRGGGAIDLIDDTERSPTERYQELEQHAADLGAEVAIDDSAFDEVLPSVLSARQGRASSFGMGLARGSIDKTLMWNRLREKFATLPRSERQIDTFRGFLFEISRLDQPKAESVLDGLSADNLLYEWLPPLQASVAITDRGLARLRDAMRTDAVPIGRFRSLAGSPAATSIPGADLSEMVLELSSRENGFVIAMDIVWMRLHHEQASLGAHDQHTLYAGRNLLSRFVFGSRNQHEDYVLGDLCKACLVGAEGTAVARDIGMRLRNAILAYETHAINHDDLIVGLFTAQPHASLGAFLDNLAQLSDLGRLAYEFRNYRKNPLEIVPIDAVLSWCDEIPQERYVAMAAVVTISPNLNGEGPREWTPIALKLLDSAPNSLQVLAEYVSQLHPMSWSGSRASVLETNAALLDKLVHIQTPEFLRALEGHKSQLQVQIQQERVQEASWDRSNVESFE